MHMTLARFRAWIAWQGVRQLERQHIARSPRSLRSHLNDRWRAVLFGGAGVVAAVALLTAVSR